MLDSPQQSSVSATAVHSGESIFKPGRATADIIPLTLVCTQSTSTMPTIVGLGDPIVDVIIPLSHASFDQLGLQPGGSTPLDSEAITLLLTQIPEDTPRNEYVCA